MSTTTSAYGSELLPAIVASLKKFDENSPVTVWTSKELYICENWTYIPPKRLLH